MIACDVCGADLVPPAGWVVWFHEHHPSKIVRAFYTTCHPTDQGGERCLAIVEHRHRDLNQADHHLSSFAGVLTTKRFAQLVTLYDWPKPLLEKLADFMVLASALPSPSLREVKTHDMMMGGLPLEPVLRAQGKRPRPAR